MLSLTGYHPPSQHKAETPEVAPSSSPLRVALYLRVSDSRSEVENQRRDLESMVEGRGWRIVREFVDEGKTAWVDGSTETRPGLRDLALGAHRGEFDAVLIWALDRLTREGPEVAFRLIRKLREAGVELVSHQEPSLSLAGVAGDVMVAVSASYAQAYSDRLSARVKAGMERARSQGVHLGRPKTLIDEVELMERSAAGLSIAEIAISMSLPKSTVGRRLKQLKEREAMK